MKVALPNQDAGTEQLYIGHAMAGEYDRPGVEIQETDDDVRYITVKKSVGEILVEEHGFEEITSEVEEASDETEETAEPEETELTETTEETDESETEDDGE